MIEIAIGTQFVKNCKRDIGNLKTIFQYYAPQKWCEKLNAFLFV